VKRSSERILVSHTGNLPRPANLQTLVDDTGDAFAGRLPGAVKEVVERQIAAGIDQVNDGEYVKRSGFGGYIRERMRGIEVREQGPRPGLGSAWQSENVIAGTDCGLGTRTGHAEITWAKLEAMAEGARLASEELHAGSQGRVAVHAV
jgi:methionine synthase II (cobalamin-independent)